MDRLQEYAWFSYKLMILNKMLWNINIYTKNRFKSTNFKNMIDFHINSWFWIRCYETLTDIQKTVLSRTISKICIKNRFMRTDFKNMHDFHINSWSSTKCYGTRKYIQKTVLSGPISRLCLIFQNILTFWIKVHEFE